jgi:hypothetical protein
MMIKTSIFKLWNGRYQSLCELALAMEIPKIKICRVRDGKDPINEQFITGSIKAFPEHRLDELFYIAPD